jgi:hypothetical protein
MAHFAEASFCISNLLISDEHRAGELTAAAVFHLAEDRGAERCRDAISGEGSKDDADVDAIERALAVSPQLSAIS